MTASPGPAPGGAGEGAATRVFHAAWIVPVARPPVRGGWVAVTAGRIAAVGPEGGRASAPPPGESVDVGEVALLPGLVNAHAHLELSWLRGQVPGDGAFSSWIRRIIDLRRAESEANAPARAAAAAAAVAECERAGTAAVGDVANSWLSIAPLAASRLRAVVFREVLGFPAGRAGAIAAAARTALAGHDVPPSVRLAVGVHAPYSTSPQLIRTVAGWVAQDPAARSTVHVGESAEEMRFLARGDGPFRRLLDDLEAWEPTWQAPACDPVAYLDGLGALGERWLYVHGVHLGRPALDRLARRGATLVTCPRGNRLTGAGTPPVEAWYAAGVRVAVGTDSLASVPDLNLFSELAELRRLAPAVPAARLLDSATRQGARALGWEADLGTIEPGKHAALLAVSLPAGTEDVEQYLVSGVEPSQVRWVG